MRLLGASAMVALTALLYWLVTDETFRVTEERVTISGLSAASEAELRDRLGDMSRSPNVFRVRTSELVELVATMPAVRDARATVTLPADVRIHVTERRPLFVWTAGRSAWLVDESGLLFASAVDPDGAAPRIDAAGPAPDPADSAGSGEPADPAGPAAPEPTEPADQSLLPDAQDLPTVEDDRSVSVPVSLGSQLPAIDLAVMRQLLAVTPEMLGSSSGQLHLRIDESDGYVLRSADPVWRAVFGHYTPTVQPPDLVPAQVQCLRWVLGQWEPRLEVARLAISPDGCGTITLRSGGG